MKAIRDLTMQMQFTWNTVDVGTAGSTVIIHQITFRLHNALLLLSKRLAVTALKVHLKQNQTSARGI